MLLAGVMTFWPHDPVQACTNFLVSRGASRDGSTIISYAADSHDLYGSLVVRPAADYPPGSVRIIIDWDSGKRLGEIPQVPHTYRVVGNMNEHGLSIGETTWGGREELADPAGIIDYGSLMYIALERARTAREAIEVMTSLANQYGYPSSGESFSIADPQEVWLLEMIGKGKEKRGVVWAACRIPEGYITAHANYPRIRRIDKELARWCRYSDDAISFAREKGYFKGRDEEFSFAEVYAPLDFEALRICEARVWSFFRRAAPSLNLSPRYVMGDTNAEPLPLWIKPDRPLAVGDMFELMRDHFEDSPMYLGRGVGAGPFELPYRWRPLTWEVDGVKYFNERSTSTQQTGFSFVAQSRSSLPPELGGVLWFGVDDTASTVYMPIYAALEKSPPPLSPETADFHHFSWDSAFWVFNAVAHLAYGRYRDVIKDVRQVQRELEGTFLARQGEVEQAALELYKQSPRLAREYLARYSTEKVVEVLERWRRLWQELFVKYLDGNVRDEKGNVTHPPYPPEWYRLIVKESGLFYRVRDEKNPLPVPLITPAGGCGTFCPLEPPR